MKTPTVEDAARALLDEMDRHGGQRPEVLEKAEALDEALAAPRRAPRRPPCPDCSIPMALTNENWECRNAGCCNFVIYQPGDEITPLSPKLAAGEEARK